MYRWDFPTINRAITFRDIPLKGSCIMSIVDIYLQWVTKRYILYRVALLKHPLKFSGALFQDIYTPDSEVSTSTIQRVLIISVSFEIYGYLPISPSGSVNVNFVTFIVSGTSESFGSALNLICQKRKIKVFMKLVNLRVVKCNFRKQKSKLLTIAEPKGAKCGLRKSNPNNYGLNQGIIPDVGLINFSQWKHNR